MYKISEQDVAPLELSLSEEQKTALLEYIFKIGLTAESMRDVLTTRWSLYQDHEAKQEAIVCDQVASLIDELEEAIEGCSESVSRLRTAPARPRQLQEAAPVSP